MMRMVAVVMFLFPHFFLSFLSSFFSLCLFLAGADGSQAADTKLQQMAFSRSQANLLYMVFPREILIMDLEILQTIGAIVVERSQAPLQFICLASTHDTIYCLHRNGLMTARHRARQHSTNYTLVAQSETLRLPNKSARVVGMCLSPGNECNLSLVTSDGRVLIYEVINQEEEGGGRVRNKTNPQAN